MLLGALLALLLVTRSYSPNLHHRSEPVIAAASESITESGSLSNKHPEQKTVISKIPTRCLYSKLSFVLAALHLPCPTKSSNEFLKKWLQRYRIVPAEKKCSGSRLDRTRQFIPGLALTKLSGQGGFRAPGP